MPAAYVRAHVEVVNGAACGLSALQELHMGSEARHEERSKEMNIELLKRLRTRFLGMRHPKHFRMAQVAIKTDCGAAMCMIGHVLNLEGYKMRAKRNYKPADDEELWGDDDPARSDYDFINPLTKTAIQDPLVVAANLLGMSKKEAETELFYRYELKTPKQAAARIQELIDAAKKEGS